MSKTTTTTFTFLHEQYRYASTRITLAVVLIQISKPLHNFHIQICNFGQCNVGVVFKWKVHHGNNWADTVDSNRLSIVLARICPTVLFEFVPIMSIVRFPVGICERGRIVFWPKQSQPVLLASFERGSMTMKDAWRLHKISKYMSRCNH